MAQVVIQKNADGQWEVTHTVSQSQTEQFPDLDSAVAKVKELEAAQG